MGTKKDFLINIISKNSNEYGNLLIEFMDKYKISSLMQATEFELNEFIKENNLKEVIKDEKRRNL